MASSPRTPTLTQSSTTFVSISTASEIKVKPRIIFEGPLYIQGWFSAWRTRYVQLCANRTVQVYNKNKEEINEDTHPKHILDLSTVITIKQTQNPNLLPLNIKSKKNNKNKKSKFVFEITTAKQNILLASHSEDMIDQWVNHLNCFVFGDIIHFGYMTKQGFKIKSWKKRWFTLSLNWKELRYYENDKMTKNEYKGKINLCLVNVLRSYVNFHKNEYILELITEKRTYIFVNEFHDEHIDWMNKLEYVLKGNKTCCYCHKNKLNIFGVNENNNHNDLNNNNNNSNNKSVYYKMSSLHEGILNAFTAVDKNDIEKGGQWDKYYYAIDGRTMRLFYTKNIEKMESFQNALIEKNFYEKYISQQMDGYYLLFGEPIEMIDVIIDDDISNNQWYDNEFTPGGTTTTPGGEPADDDLNDLNDFIKGPGFMDTPGGPTTTPGGFTPGGFTPGGDLDDFDDGKDDIKQTDDMKPNHSIIQAFDKYKYKFSIGEHIFGVNNAMEAKLWVAGLKNAIDFSMREIYNYDDEKHYLCRMHLSLLICRFYCSYDKYKNQTNDDMEIPFGAYKYIVKCIGIKCWDNDNLITF